MGRIHRRRHHQAIAIGFCTCSNFKLSSDEIGLRVGLIGMSHSAMNITVSDIVVEELTLLVVVDLSHSP